MVPKALAVDLRPVFRSDREIDRAVSGVIIRALAQKVALLESIPGKGSGTLKRRVRARVAQSHLRKLYCCVETDGANEGRILVHSDPRAHASAEEPLEELVVRDTLS